MTVIQIFCVYKGQINVLDDILYSFYCPKVLLQLIFIVVLFLGVAALEIQPHETVAIFCFVFRPSKFMEFMAVTYGTQIPCPPCILCPRLYMSTAGRHGHGISVRSISSLPVFLVTPAVHSVLKLEKSKSVCA